MSKGLDISLYQGAPNFDTLKNNFDFIIIKATEGVGYADPQFKRSQLEARRVGLALGYYAFARPNLGNSAESEANWFLQTIGELKEGEVLVLDFEVQFANPVPWCKTWLDTVTAKTGCKPLIYLNKSQIEGFNWNPVINADYGLWLAFYDGNPDTISFDTKWPAVAMKQYTSSGQVDGTNGNVDLDTFFGDVSTFKAYGYRPLVPPTPTTQPGWTDQTAVPLNFTTVLETYGEISLGTLRSKLQAKDEAIKNLVQNKITLGQRTEDLTQELNTANNKILELQSAAQPSPVMVPVAPTFKTAIGKALYKWALKAG